MSTHFIWVINQWLQRLGQLIHFSAAGFHGVNLLDEPFSPISRHRRTLWLTISWVRGGVSRGGGRGTHIGIIILAWKDLNCPLTRLRPECLMRLYWALSQRGRFVLPVPLVTRPRRVHHTALHHPPPARSPYSLLVAICSTRLSLLYHNPGIFRRPAMRGSTFFRAECTLVTSLSRVCWTHPCRD